MTITRPKALATNAEKFVSSAPDSSSTATEGTATIKTKRGINRSQVSIVLADSLLLEIDQLANQRYMSRSALITMALTQLLAQRK